ncbi:MAG: hypothetical protein UT82_C0016G0014 [Parcubacteria group bacterium GW2011_GWB1_40_14]|nr:MAG: hypothetical protein UT82_C0016G0014 [Parcubacteria group bacterium GW2011_GWB1_40_14]
MEWFLLTLLLGIIFAFLVSIIMTRSHNAPRSRYSHTTREIVRRLRNEDNYNVLQATRDLWSARSDSILVDTLYERTIIGKLNWCVGNKPVYHLYLEKKRTRVDFNIEKIIDLNESSGRQEKVILTVRVGSGPKVRIETNYRDKNENSDFYALVQLHDYLVENYPLNPSVSFGKPLHLNEAEAIILEKATDIITSV